MQYRCSGSRGGCNVAGVGCSCHVRVSRDDDPRVGYSFVGARDDPVTLWVNRVGEGSCRDEGIPDRRHHHGNKITRRVKTKVRRVATSHKGKTRCRSFWRRGVAQCIVAYHHDNMEYSQSMHGRHSAHNGPSRPLQTPYNFLLLLFAEPFAPQPGR